jgi:hypothetical protein
MKYYLYISDAKLDMLYAQMPARIRDRIATEMKIDLKLVSATFSAKDRSESRYSRLDLVCEYIHRHLSVGTVTESAPYFEGVVPMQWGAVTGADSGSVVFFGGEQDNVVLGLAGSKHHVLGFQGEGMMGFGGSGLVQHVIEQLDRSLKGVIEGSGSSRDEFSGTSDQDSRTLHTVMDAARNISGPTQPLEFLAKRLINGQVVGSAREQRTVILGTPIYVALAD